MPGICGFINGPELTSEHPSFSQYTGVPVLTQVQPHLQLALRAIAADVGYQVLQSDDFSLFLIGDLLSHAGLDLEAPLEFVMQALQRGDLQQILPDLNGYFVLVAVDKRSERLFLATDRLGIKPLYLWKSEQHLRGFASELKSLVLHPQVELQLDVDAINKAMDFGHYLEHDTLVAGMSRLAPATLLEVNLSDGQFQEKRYWHWGVIEKQPQADFDLAVDLLFQKFDRAMQRCLSAIPQETLAITLSGGLDSRVLLAAAKQHFKGEIKTYTFGQPDCADAIIARQVAEIAGVSNELKHIARENWYEGREQGVWRTDGMFNIVHMHALSSCATIKAHSCYLLNGYLGDAFLGGSYLFGGHFEKQISTALADIKYPGKGSCFAPIDRYYLMDCTDPLFLYNRGVRFIASGTDLLATDLHNLKPFADYDLLDFVYSLPDSYRYNSRLYNAMLLKHYPEYFADVPWQQTGKPIEVVEAFSGAAKVETKPSVKAKAKMVAVKMLKGSPFERLASRCYAMLKPKSDSYVDYGAWMRTPEFRDYLTSTLSGADAKLVQLFDESLVKNTLHRFLNMPATRPEILGSLLSLEIYLRQLEQYKDT